MRTAQTIATMKATLDYLEAHYADLPRDDRWAQRSAAMDAGRAILDDEATSRDDFMAAYDLILQLDRVGY